MTNAEAIQTLKLMQAQVEWEYSMNYAAAIDEAIKALEVQEWIPCRERLPELDEDGYSEKVLTSYENFSGTDICEYRIIDGTGKWYAGDTEESPEDIGLIVNAWMPLPKPYREEQE